MPWLSLSPRLLILDCSRQRSVLLIFCISSILLLPCITHTQQQQHTQRFGERWPTRRARRPLPIARRPQVARARQFIKTTTTATTTTKMWLLVEEESASYAHNSNANAIANDTTRYRCSSSSSNNHNSMRYMMDNTDT
jgi:hypothetical protein